MDGAKDHPTVIILEQPVAVEVVKGVKHSSVVESIDATKHSPTS